MIKLGFIAAVALALYGGSAAAAPLARSGDVIAKAAAILSAIETVHGCHRVCAKGPVPRWGGIFAWHRHAGPDCWPRRCSPW